MLKQVEPAAENARFYFTIGVNSLVLLVDSGIIWALINGKISLWIGAALHVSTCLMFAMLAFLIGKRIKGQQFLLVFMLLLLLLLGPLGASAVLIIRLLHAHHQRRATPFEDWYRHVVPDQVGSAEERLMERLSLWLPQDSQQVPISFADVLASGSRAEKISAISLMLRNYNPAFAALFREALSDADNAVRVQAASAMTHIEENFLKQNLHLEKQHLAQPNSEDHLLKLAQHYDEHAIAGLCDEEATVEYRSKAEAVYRQLHQLKPRDCDILWRLGRLMIRAEKFDTAAQTIETALVLNNQCASPSQRVWYWECLYSQQRYAELRQQLRDFYHQIPQSALLPQNLLDSINLWNQSSQEHEAV